MAPFHRRIILLSTIVAMCRTNFGSEFSPKQVLLADHTSQCQGSLEQYFRAEIIFSSFQDGLVFEAGDLKKVLVSSNPVLEKMHDSVLHSYLEKLQTKDIRQQVEFAIAQGLASGVVTEEFIAGKLKLSVRSLHRKLKERQTRFQDLLDKTREQLTMNYFNDENLTLEEIAYLTGFAEYSSFSRAFKRWTGSPPSAVRNTMIRVKETGHK